MVDTNEGNTAQPKRIKGEGKVWVCDSYCGGRFYKKMTMFDDYKVITPEIERKAKLSTQYKSGFPMPVEDIPTIAWEDYPDYRVRNLTDFFTVNGYYIVSERFVETVAPFDLGGCTFHPIQFFRHDRTTPMEGKWFFFNLASRRRCFLPDETAIGRETKGGAKRRDVPDFVEAQWTLCTHGNNELAVTAEALTKPDFWLDPLIRRTFFMSGPLEAALREAKLIKGMSRWRCLVRHDIPRIQEASS